MTCATQSLLAMSRPPRPRSVLHRLPDTVGGHPLVETVTTHYDAGEIEFRPLEREDASAISTAKAQRLLGWKPTRTWRDYLDDEGLRLT